MESLGRQEFSLSLHLPDRARAKTGTFSCPGLLSRLAGLCRANVAQMYALTIYLYSILQNESANSSPCAMNFDSLCKAGPRQGRDPRIQPGRIDLLC